MTQRERIVNGILDCSSNGVPYETMEKYAKMFTDELVEVLVEHLYLLREELDTTNVEVQSLRNQIENLNNKIDATKI